MKKVEIKVPEEIYSYLWSRYLPETTFKTYILLAYCDGNNLNKEQSLKVLSQSEVVAENEIEIFKSEKEKTLKSIGFDYPITREDDLSLLVSFGLIQTAKNENGEEVFVYVMPIPKPEDSLKLSSEEIKVLTNLRFEVSHQEAFNRILTLLLNSNNNMITTMEHISKTTNIKHSDVREVLDYLVDEGSIKVKSDKKINELRKADKVYIQIIQDVFSKKRMVLD